jgi:hypothetical protein
MLEVLALGVDVSENDVSVVILRGSEDAYLIILVDEFKHFFGARSNIEFCLHFEAFWRGYF